MHALATLFLNPGVASDLVDEIPPNSHHKLSVQLPLLIAQTRGHDSPSSLGRTRPAIENHNKRTFPKPHVASAPSSITEEWPIPYYRLSELDQRPLALTHPRPTYPNSEGNLSGKIVIQLLINANGNVDRVEALPTELPATFVDAAKQAFMNIQFKPGMLGGQPVGSQLWLELLFEGGEEEINPQSGPATPLATEN